MRKLLVGGEEGAEVEEAMEEALTSKCWNFADLFSIKLRHLTIHFFNMFLPVHMQVTSQSKLCSS